MHGIISLLAPTHYKLVEDIWRELEKECGLKGIQVTPYPHFSWQIGAEYDEPQTGKIVQAIARETKPFTVHADGLGIFSGPGPIVYIPIGRSAELSQLHQKLWEQLAPYAKGRSIFYSPPRWLPHITLIFGEENRQAIMRGLEILTFRSFTWEIEVNNLSFASQFENQIATIDYRYDLLPKS